MTALDRLQEASDAYDEAQDQVVATRAALAYAIVAAAKAGIRQSEIVQITGYTRESVRRICRAGGPQTVRKTSGRDR